MKRSTTDSERPVAVVTGGSGALGNGIAIEFLQLGYRVVLVARDLGRLQRAAAELGDIGPVAVVSADVTNAADRTAIVSETLHSFGRLDVLVNNAGAEHIGRLDQHQLSDVEQLVALNLVAPIEMARAAAPMMDRVGGGHIVNICTMAAKTPMTTMAVYAATKAGLGHFSHLLRLELAPRNIGVSAVYPGAISGEGMFANMQESTGVSFPKAMPTSEPAWVAKRVASAVRRDQAHVFAAPGGKFMVRHPRFAGFLLRRLGVAKAFAEVGDRYDDSRRAADQTADVRPPNEATRTTPSASISMASTSDRDS